MNEYFESIVKLLQQIDAQESAAINSAAGVLAKTLASGGVIHTFGAGHSASVALEGFHRSGAPVQISAVLDPALMFQHGANAGTETERREGYATNIIKQHDLRAGDCIIIVSNSGRNPAGIDIAIYAKEHGLKVIVITSYAAHKDTPSRHSSGKKLADYADIVLDNFAGKDEAVLEVYDGKKAGPVSTITGAAIINALYYNAVKMLAAEGIKTPLYSSSNAGGDGENDALAQKYAARIKHI